MKQLRNLINGILYKIAPVKKNRIVFTSLNGQYSDSPKAISSAINSLFPNYQIVWLVKKSVLNEVPKSYTAIDINSLKASYYAGSAGIVIDNVYADSAFTINKNDKTGLVRVKILLWLKSKKMQHVYSTWHGSPMKKMSIDQVDSHVAHFLCNRMTMILGDQYTLDIMKRLTFNKIEMLLLGSPRNDILFSDEHYNTVKERLNLSGKKVVLFAPTFRSRLNENDDYLARSGLSQIEQINFNELLETLSQKFGGEWVFICRFHYHVAEKVNWNEIDSKYGGKVINGNSLQDMADYLACTDVLISDISSCMFDFALTKRPCFCFFPDRDLYENKERGLYVKLDSLPFPVAEDYKTLISEIIQFDDQAYKKNINDLMKSFGFISDKNSAKKIANYVVEREKNIAN